MATAVRKEGETLESLMKRFRQKVNDDGIFYEIRKREYYETKSQARRRKLHSNSHN